MHLKNVFPFSMLEGNLSKTEKLNFYIVEDEYIEYDIINSNKKIRLRLFTRNYAAILDCQKKNWQITKKYEIRDRFLKSIKHM